MYYELATMTLPFGTAGSAAISTARAAPTTAAPCA